ncbi:MAG: hypothetical protein ABH824_06750 [Nanoarchaeota archaeon]|nr:hypothetical protein [Nanoarchaeota archaeon]MBU1631706.1 hypothetical protein [Nanoarchaeota archaeon]MBU1876232.1 hypothetical protein [Nanoarchaeota archaeon]
MDNESLEYASFKYLEHWKKEDNLEKLKSSVSDDGLFYSYLYKKVEELYSHLPLRKNRQETLTHPLNTVLALKNAKIYDEIILCVGLIHDFIEDNVDLYKITHEIEEDDEGIKYLDEYEINVLDKLEKELREFYKSNHIENEDKECEERVKLIIKTLKLLTRHKRDFYYRSISNIFQCEDEKAKEIAIQVKLADRMHNIQCIECFSEEKRIFQCFKNLFILNNTKNYLLEEANKNKESEELSPTQLLFKRCAKSTYDAFLTICNTCFAKGMGNTQSMIQLAFKKFAMEKSGVWEVTKVDKNETHLIKLFQGVIRKYDARLHHEWEKFNRMREVESNYCRNFFGDFRFTEEQIRAIIDYKDAYAMKEIIANLLYFPDYVLSKFLSSELNLNARIDN